MAEPTEKELFEAMLKRAQVPYKEEPSDRKFARSDERQIRMKVPFGTLDQLQGYFGFETKFHFDVTGRLLTVGIWE